MVGYYNGEYITLTPEQEQELLSNVPTPVVTTGERIQALEQAVAELSMVNMEV